jgi:C4-dicarboxylate-specific signal transduction histidine kinase
MLNLLGVPAEAVCGRPCYEAFHGRSLPVENCVLVQVRQSLRRQTAVWQRDGKWYDVTGDPILDESGRLTGIVHIMSDITGQRQADEARRAAEAELELQRAATMRGDRLRSLGQMAAGIAHELNQPLVGVRGLAEHLLIGMDRGWKASDEQVQKKLEMIIEQADRMSHLIEHVRTFARDAGKPECRTVQVNDVVRSALELLGAQLRAQGLAWECEFADALSTVWANPFSLEEVVLNLVLNSRDAVAEVLQAGGTPEQPHIRVRTRQSREGEAGRVELQVIDRGTGIPPERLASLFEPFFTTKPQGTGLGLAICKSIVEQFGGTISLESTVGWGTSVTVSLPAEGGKDEPT